MAGKSAVVAATDVIRAHRHLFLQNGINAHVPNNHLVLAYTHTAPPAVHW